MALTEKELSTAKNYLVSQFMASARSNEFSVAGVASGADGVLVYLEKEISDKKKQIIADEVSAAVGRPLSKAELKYEVSGPFRAGL
jgi:hypothetical protein